VLSRSAARECAPVTGVHAVARPTAPPVFDAPWHVRSGACPRCFDDSPMTPISGNVGETQPIAGDTAIPWRMRRRGPHVRGQDDAHGPEQGAPLGSRGMHRPRTNTFRAAGQPGSSSARSAVLEVHRYRNEWADCVVAMTKCCQFSPRHPAVAVTIHSNGTEGAAAVTVGARRARLVCTTGGF